ncbi:MAG: Na+/H+ antiporter subunit E [Pseudomonadota bacterium]
MIKTFVISFINLALLWLLLSGYLKTNLLVLGVISCILVTIMAILMKVYLSNDERIKFAMKMPLYLPWLFKEILLGNLHLAKKIIFPASGIQPQCLNIKPSQKTNTGIALHANSITLTPGTISMDYDDETLYVHALTDHTAQDVIDGEMDRRITKIEGSIK